ncbi:MAG: maleylpyruvate isomerase N-terminal domain-containing protein [Janthinobacterium lividum]
MDPVLRVPHGEGRDAFVDALESFLAAVEPLDDHALLGASGCWGWTVVDVVTHVRLGLEELASCLLAAETSDAEPDRDAATYWLVEPPGGGSDEVAGLVAIRRIASATQVPRSALLPLRTVTSALGTAADRLAEGVLAFQGCVLTTGDLFATWAVELAVHQLDLAREVDVAAPPPAALEMARRTVDASTRAGLPVPAFAGRIAAPVSSERS